MPWPNNKGGITKNPIIHSPFNKSIPLNGILPPPEEEYFRVTNDNDFRITNEDQFRITNDQ
jgi:hypothetical protein